MQGMRTMITAAAAALLFSLSVAAQEAKPVEIESEGAVLVGDDTTIGQAKAAALNNARRAALEKATGVEVHGSTVVYNNQLIDDLVLAATRGLIVKETVLENKCLAKDGQISCIARIKASVKPLTLERRGNFGITRLTVQRPDREPAAASPVFQSGDEIQVRVSANQDVYLNIFSVDRNGGIAALYPNDYVKWERQPADKELVFPGDALRKNGLRLRVKTPKGSTRAVESVLVIATKEKTPFLKGRQIENPTITDLMRELSEMDPSQWVEQTEGYEVRE